VFSEDLGSCVPAWKNPSRTRGCKWSLLTVRKKEIQREHGRMQVESAGKRACFSFSGAFKSYINPWGGQIQELPTQL
jgi:hypothetical protein